MSLYYTRVNSGQPPLSRRPFADENLRPFAIIRVVMGRIVFRLLREVVIVVLIDHVRGAFDLRRKVDANNSVHRCRCISGSDTSP